MTMGRELPQPINDDKVGSVIVKMQWQVLASQRVQDRSVRVGSTGDTLCGIVTPWSLFHLTRADCSSPAVTSNKAPMIRGWRSDPV
jgi:hypothetical protein